MLVPLQSIREAADRIKDAIYRSPCTYSLSLSRLCGVDVFCKLEHLQMTGSFKERGARNKLLQLTPEQKKAGVIAASAGNHALGLAYHGQLLGTPVTVVMPRFAPLVKVANAKSFGATVILHGDSFDEAREKAHQLAKERNIIYVNGFDDPDIIAGAGTIGLEILEDLPDAAAVIVPVGGGGLISGIAAAIKPTHPHIEIIAVEPAHAPTVSVSLEAGAVTRVKTKPTLADGLAVAQVGTLCLEIVKNCVDRILLVDETAIAKSVLRLLELEKMVVEGAGAVPLAAIMDMEQHNLAHLASKKVVLVLGGGNIDVTMIGRVIDRGLASDGRLTHISADIPDRPGALARLLTIVADVGGSIQEVRHDRHFGPPDVGLVRILLTIETRDFEHVREIHAAFERADIKIIETNT